MKPISVVAMGPYHNVVYNLHLLLYLIALMVLLLMWWYAIDNLVFRKTRK